MVFVLRTVVQQMEASPLKANLQHPAAQKVPAQLPSGVAKTTREIFPLSALDLYVLCVVPSSWTVTCATGVYPYKSSLRWLLGDHSDIRDFCQVVGRLFKSWGHSLRLFGEATRPHRNVH
eukprot:3665186-Amphidinium_carterae.1